VPAAILTPPCAAACFLPLSGSVATSCSGSPDSRSASGFLNSPTAAAAAAVSGNQQQPQQQALEQGGKRKPFKMHGMEPYEYWSLIKGL
jgi:hypothetical protein